MSSPNLLIHIGYQKAASTWLQQNVFSKEETGFFAPMGAPSAEMIRHFVIANSFMFSPELILRAFEQCLKETKKSGLIPVLSHEDLAGDHIRGKYWGKEVADKINAVFPKSKILIIIREQKSMVLSSYKQHIKQGGTATISEFISTCNLTKGIGPLCQLDYFEYHRLIEYYISLFGSNQVLVLPLELLGTEPLLFEQKILDFTNSSGVIDFSKKPQNVGQKGASLAFQRRLNFLFQPSKYGRLKNPITWRVSCKLSREVEKKIPSVIHQRFENQWKVFINEFIKNKFRKSNQITSDLIKVDLLKLGYDL